MAPVIATTMGVFASFFPMRQLSLLKPPMEAMARAKLWWM